MSKEINLKKIVTIDNFLKKLLKAAKMSLSSNKEAGFSVYIDESLSKTYINRPVLGEVEKIKELGLIEHSISNELTTDNKKKGYGAHVPLNHYTMLYLHFHTNRGNSHPPCPSGADITSLLGVRELNVSLSEHSGIEREIRRGQLSELKGCEKDYVNPISAVGIANSPGNIKLIFYQEKTKEPIDSNKFFEYAAQYCSKMDSARNDRYYSSFLETFGFFNRFKSIKQVLEFLNSSKYLQATALRVKNGKPVEKDLDNLEKFKLIQTRFYKA